MTCPYCHHEHDKDFGCKPYVDKVALGLCMRPGCDNKLKSKRARFCSGACKVAAHRKAKKPLGLIEEPPVPTAFSNVLKGDGSLGDGTIYGDDGKPLAPPPPGVVQVAKERVLTTPCPPDCERKGEDHIHVSMPDFASNAHHPRCRPDKCGLTPRECREMPDAPPLSEASLEAAGKVLVASKPAKGDRLTFDRSHAPGCPCWTCKGIPAKKPKKP